MKINKFIFFILLSSAQLLSSQNIQTVVVDSVGEADPGQEIALGGYIINLTANPLDIELIRYTNDIPANWMTSLCLELCAAPWIDTIIGTVQAFDSLEFSIHFFTDQVPGSGESLLITRELKTTDGDTNLFRATTLPTNVTTINRKDLSFRLWGNYPNPFNNATTIRFQSALPVQEARLSIFSIDGTLVYEKRSCNLPAGESVIYFYGRDQHDRPLTSGAYVYRLSLLSNSGSVFSDGGKLTLLK